MAYGTKYQFTFTDLHAVNPVEWSVQFRFKDYAGDATDLQPAKTPLTFHVGQDSKDKLDPFLASEADITIQVDDRDFPKNTFYTAEEDAIQVYITRADFVFFTGFVKPDFCEYPYTVAPYEFTISASDGIGFLKGKTLDLDTEARGDNQIGIIDLLTTRGLYFAQHSTLNTLNLLSSLHRGTNTPFDGVKTRVELLYDDSSLHTFLDIYKALSYIATSFTSRILCANGVYWMQRIADIPQSNTPTLYAYINPGNDPSQSSDQEIFKVLGSDPNTDDLIFANNDSYITITAPYKNIKTSIDYKFIGSLKNFDWYYWDGSSFLDWTALDSHLAISRMANSDDDSKYSMFIENYSAGTTYLYQRVPVYGYNIISIKTKIKFYGLSKMKIIFKMLSPDGGIAFTDAYDQVSNSWQPQGSADGYYIERSGDPNTDTAEINLQLPFYNQPTFGINTAAPRPYYFEIDIVDPDTAYADGSANPGVEVWPIGVTVRYNDAVGEVDNVNNPKSFSVEKEIDDFILIDGPKNAANTLNYPDEVTPLTWSSTDQAYASSQLQAIQLRSMMDAQSYAYEEMKGSYYSNSINFFNAIKRKEDGKIFLIMQDDYDVKNCLHRMKLFEITPVATSTPTLVVSQDFKKGEAFNSIS